MPKYEVRCDGELPRVLGAPNPSTAARWFVKEAAEAHAEFVPGVVHVQNVVTRERFSFTAEVKREVNVYVQWHGRQLPVEGDDG